MHRARREHTMPYTHYYILEYKKRVKVISVRLSLFCDGVDSFRHSAANEIRAQHKKTNVVWSTYAEFLESSPSYFLKLSLSLMFMLAIPISNPWLFLSIRKYLTIERKYSFSFRHFRFFLLFAKSSNISFIK